MWSDQGHPVLLIFQEETVTPHRARSPKWRWYNFRLSCDADAHSSDWFFYVINQVNRAKIQAKQITQWYQSSPFDMNEICPPCAHEFPYLYFVITAFVAVNDQEFVNHFFIVPWHVDIAKQEPYAKKSIREKCGTGHLIRQVMVINKS